jgi:serine/threonine-protein kinase RsbW
MQSRIITALQENRASIVGTWSDLIVIENPSYRALSREEITRRGDEFLQLLCKSLMEGSLEPLDSFLDNTASLRAGMGFPLEEVHGALYCARDVMIPILRKEFPREKERYGVLLVLDEYIEEIVVRLTRKYQKNYAAVMESQHAIFRTIFEKSLDGIVILDDHHRVTIANPSARLYAGLEHQDIVGMTCGDLFGNALHEMQLRCRRGCPGSNGSCGRKGQEHELCIVGPSGMERWVQVVCSRIDGPLRPGHGTVILMRDVTRDRKNYRRLEENWRGLDSIASVTKAIQLKIPCMSQFAVTVRNQTEIIARRAHFTGRRIHDIKTAVGEACDNAIEHGRSHHGVDICYRLHDDGISIEVEDHGGGFDVTSRNDQCPDPMDERGRGFFLMKLLMDKVEIDSRVGQGTKVTLFAGLKRDAAGKARFT